MPDPRDIRSRLLEGLPADERAGVEDTVALLARAAPPAPPPPFELETRTLAAIRTATRANGTGVGLVPEGRRVVAAPRRRRRLRFGRPAFAAGLAVALAAGVLVGTMLGGDGGLPGTTEVEATLRAPNGASAEAIVSKTGIGRVVDFRTGDLPILPQGEYYELWFVGPRDRPGRPDRISAGTFHPDEGGRSDVRFTAAVDPAKYPGLAVTAEPGDGNPAPQGPDVMRFSGSSQP